MARFQKFQIIIPLCMVIFIDTFAMTLIYPVFAPLISLDVANGGFFSSHLSTQIKDGLYGLTMAIYAIFMFFTAPLLGDFSDKIGRKKVLLICLSGAGISAALSGFAILTHSFILFFTARIIAGSMAGSLPVAQAAIADMSDEQEKAVNISLIGFSYTLGVIIGPTVGGVLSNKNIISWFGFETPFFMTTLLSLFNIIILIGTFKETWVTGLKKSIHFFKPLIMFAQAARHPDIRNILLVCFFYVLGWSIYLPFTALHLFQQYRFTSPQIGYFVSWIALIMSMTMLLGVRLVTRYFSILKILYLAISLSILGIIICMIHDVVIQWISAVPIACGMGLAYTAITTLFSNSVDSQLQGWIMGVSASTMAAAAAIGGVLVGLVSINDKMASITMMIIWMISFLFSLGITQKK